MVANLAHALSGHAQRTANITQRPSLIAIEAKISANNISLPSVERGIDRPRYELGLIAVHHELIRLLFIGLEYIHQRLLARRVYRRGQRQVWTHTAQRPLCTRVADLHIAGDFVQRGHAPQFLSHLPPATRHPVHILLAICGHSHSRCALERVEHALSNPPHGVADELKPAFFVESLEGFHQSHIALGNQIGKGYTPTLIFERNTDDKTQV